LALAVLLNALLPARAGELAGYKLLLTSIRTGDTEVFVVDPDTGDATNVSRSPESEDRYPCWSPSGKRIAFTSDRNPCTNLYVRNADGSGLVRIIHSSAVCYMPSWQETPQGERIVFGMHGVRAEIASVRPDGSDLRMLGVGHDPCLSPDGRTISYAGEVPGGVTVFLMDYDGRNPRRLVPGASRPGGVFPNWSPDNRQIVYSWPVGAALELCVINSDGTANHQLTHTGGICTPPAWSPDGKWISFRFTDEAYWRNKEKMAEVYSRKPADKRPVWVIHPDGTQAHVIECLRFQCAIDGSRASWRPR
jgi:Tol biopolymer transport system component